MKWDGKRYIRGDDVLVWADSEAGMKYTPEEFVSSSSIILLPFSEQWNPEAILDYVDGQDRVRSERVKESNH